MPFFVAINNHRNNRKHYHRRQLLSINTNEKIKIVNLSEINAIVTVWKQKTDDFLFQTPLVAKN